MAVHELSGGAAMPGRGGLRWSRLLHLERPVRHRGLLQHRDSGAGRGAVRDVLPVLRVWRMLRGVPEVHREQPVPGRPGVRRRIVSDVHDEQPVRSHRAVHRKPHRVPVHVLSGRRLHRRRDLLRRRLLAHERPMLPRRRRRHPGVWFGPGVHQGFVRSLLHVRRLQQQPGICRPAGTTGPRVHQRRLYELHGQQPVRRRRSVRRRYLRHVRHQCSVRAGGPVHQRLLHVHLRPAVCDGAALWGRGLRRDVNSRIGFLDDRNGSRSRDIA